jgi:hypothetical protein
MGSPTKLSPSPARLTFVDVPSRYRVASTESSNSSTQGEIGDVGVVIFDDPALPKSLGVIPPNTGDDASESLGGARCRMPRYCSVDLASSSAQFGRGDGAPWSSSVRISMLWRMDAESLGDALLPMRNVVILQAGEARGLAIRVRSRS